MQHDPYHNYRWNPWSVVVGIGEAIRFLTIIPQPWLPPTHERSAVIAIPWFPVAGLVIGALLCLVGWLAGWFWSDLVAAALVVVSWEVITGGLHLDGLSDTFDGVLSWRSPERKLEIMKDSRIGVMGALALIAVLLLKVALLAGGGAAWWQAALLAPVLGRWAACYAIFFFPAAAAGGLGRALHDQARRADVMVASATTVALAALVAGAGGLAALLAVWAATHLLARWWTRSLGGLTGDTYGALCEIAEVVALATLTARPIFGGG
ncbi:MAG: adenosylcobinamide-GDP ribazoletransferase [Oscillochloridaceae bacterium]|nr:adenosylcobinamide-GDP ribazoletransferase [Chloroflexaceae bacterium]MDW8391135.1 adenosylcobinamide-GDP ribazoletransferase [Oscillochloridaceae bacterium]